MIYWTKSCSSSAPQMIIVLLLYYERGQYQVRKKQAKWEQQYQSIPETSRY